MGQSMHGFSNELMFAKEAIQEAINRFNQDHADELPPAHSNEWRQVVKGAYPKDDMGKVLSSDQIPIRNQNGQINTFSVSNTHLTLPTTPYE